MIVSTWNCTSSCGRWILYAGIKANYPVSANKHTRKPRSLMSGVSWLVRDSNPLSVCNIEIHIQANTRGNTPNSSTTDAKKCIELPSNTEALAHQLAHEVSTGFSQTNLNISGFLEIAEYSQCNWSKRLDAQFCLSTLLEGASCG
jgi:hypothetical protein